MRESTHSILYLVKRSIHADGTARYEVSVFIQRLVRLGDESIYGSPSNLYNLDIWLKN
jgi:hypothetical protein